MIAAICAPGPTSSSAACPTARFWSILTKPPPAAKVTNLTLIEGKTRAQIDKLLRAQGVRGSYTAATRHSPLLDPRRYGAPRSTPSLEGFLFPSTYQLRKPIKVACARLRPAQAVPQGLRRSRPEGRRAAPPDALRRPDHRLDGRGRGLDRARPAADVASVIINRLARRMPLQIDATTRYATGNYTKPLTVSQLNSRSPFNTRLRTGPAADPDRQPGARCDPGRRQPATEQLPLLRRQAVRQRRDDVHRRTTSSSCATRRATRPHARSEAAARPSTAKARRKKSGHEQPDPPRRTRVAGGPQPFAGDAERGSGRRRAGRLAVPVAPSAAGSASRRPSERCPVPASAAPT